MCHFLTISIPGKTVPEVPNEFRRKVLFTEHTNRSVTEHTPPDWTSFTATSGGCSCDFYRAEKNPPEDRSKLEKKYRKKGWSDAKIQKALESPKAPPPRSVGLRDDILDLVTDLANAFGEIRLSLHWYSGYVETENFALRDVGRISLEDFRQDSSALRDETTIKIKAESVITPADNPSQGRSDTEPSIAKQPAARQPEGANARKRNVDPLVFD